MAAFEPFRTISPQAAFARPWQESATLPAPTAARQLSLSPHPELQDAEVEREGRISEDSPDGGLVADISANKKEARHQKSER
jgi:hypothetical protein